MPKGPQAQKPISWVFGHLKVQNVNLFDYVCNDAMLVLVLFVSKKVSFPFFRRSLIWLLGEKQSTWTMGPMGPRGLGPNPFWTVSPCPPGVFVLGKNTSPKKIMRTY